VLAVDDGDLQQERTISGRDHEQEQQPRSRAGAAAAQEQEQEQEQQQQSSSSSSSSEREQREQRACDFTVRKPRAFTSAWRFLVLAIFFSVLAIFSVLVLVLEYERVLRLTYLLASGPSPNAFKISRSIVEGVYCQLR